MDEGVVAYGGRGGATAGRESRNLDNYDFAADTKAPKRAARAMMQMTREINERLIPAAGLDRPMPSSEYFKKRLSEFKQEK